MAKTYIEAHSDVLCKPKIAILDGEDSIGGTWAAERLYPGLNTNNVVGSYEFSDFPMDPDKYGVQPGRHIPGSVVHRYLSDFAHHFGIRPLIRFGAQVHTADLQQPHQTWLVSYSTSTGARNMMMIARKMVIATGLTSEPRIPQYPGEEKFKGHMFHARHLRARSDDLESSRSVVVVGGNKSAWDVCYAAARAGAEVHMVIRTSGGGPSWVWKTAQHRHHPVLKHLLSISRLSSTRIFTWFDPTPSGHTYQRARRFLRATWLGQLLCLLFWRLLDCCVRHATGYDDHDANIRLLRPWSSTFWMGNSLSVHNYDSDWFELARRGGRITVHHAEIASMDESHVRLSGPPAGGSGSIGIAADAVVLCTGWKHGSTIVFGPGDQVAQLGISGGGGGVEHPAEPSREADAIILVRQKILQECPELRRPPSRQTHPSPMGAAEGESNLKTASTASLEFENPKYYRAMIPSSQLALSLRNIAFIGMHQSVHTAMVAQAQALWITAFFGDHIPTLVVDRAREIHHEALFEAEYQRLRRPRAAAGAGGRYADLVFDSLAYVDALLEDLQVNPKRKESWWRDVFEPYKLGDYKGLVQEWLSARRPK